MYKKSVKGIVEEYLSDLTKEEMDIVVWDLTEYPGFWSDKTLSPEDNFKKQLKEIREKLDSGISILEQQATVYDEFDKAWKEYKESERD